MLQQLLGPLINVVVEAFPGPVPPVQRRRVRVHRFGTGNVLQMFGGEGPGHVRLARLADVDAYR